MEQSEVRVFPFYFGSSYYNMSERSEVQWNEQRHAFHLSFVLIHFTFHSSLHTTIVVLRFAFVFC